MHSLRYKTKCKVGFVTSKINISKAYNHVEWLFLLVVMRKIGFLDKWISVVIDCLKTTHFTFIINDCLRGLVTPIHGIHQGCPPSPSLFILCVKRRLFLFWSAI